MMKYLAAFSNISGLKCHRSKTKVIPIGIFDREYILNKLIQLDISIFILTYSRSEQKIGCAINLSCRAPRLYCTQYMPDLPMITHKVSHSSHY